MNNIISYIRLESTFVIDLNLYLQISDNLSEMPGFSEVVSRTTYPRYFNEVIYRDFVSKMQGFQFPNEPLKR